MELFETTMLKGKTQPVSIEQVKRAYERVRLKGGAGGVDRIEIPDYEKSKAKNLYKLWNRMASGSYYPQAVRSVAIPKADGSKRILGIPTLSDRVAQQVAKDVLEPVMEKLFHVNSYGYRPKVGAHEAIGVCRERCWQKPYVIDLDIKGFFDNIDHEEMLAIVSHYTQERWLLLYIERWLKAPVQGLDGKLEKREKGTPQGGVISPLLANMYLHEVFDTWISRTYPQVKWERYADDIIIHCESESEAQGVLDGVKSRLESKGLTAHEGKTKIVFCPNGQRKRNYPTESFDFLGYRFQPRNCVTAQGNWFVGFTPSISPKACKHIREVVRKHRLHRLTHLELPIIAQQLEAKIRGWLYYYGKFTPSGIGNLLRYWLNQRLALWVCHKYKSCRGNIKKGIDKLKEICRDFPTLFVHWRYGYCP
jgi:RNA-directed DNA polymerase